MLNFHVKFVQTDRQTDVRTTVKQYAPPSGVAAFYLNPFPNNKFLDSSNLKEFADDNFKFDENGKKFSSRVENTVGKGEIAPYEQLLLFPQCFQKT